MQIHPKGDLLGKSRPSTLKRALDNTRVETSSTQAGKRGSGRATLFKGPSPPSHEAGATKSIKIQQCGLRAGHRIQKSQRRSQQVTGNGRNDLLGIQLVVCSFHYKSDNPSPSVQRMQERNSGARLC